MDISKINEITKNLPKVEPLPLKYGNPKTEDIKKLAKEMGLPVKEYNIKELEDFDDLGFPKNMSQEEIKKGLEKFGLKGSSPEDVGKLQPLEKVDENAPTTKFDAQAFFANKNNPVVMYLDEICINGITGETFTNGENN